MKFRLLVVCLVVSSFACDHETPTAAAQVELTNLHENGDGALRGETEAIRRFRQGAERGDAYSQFELGQAYHEGEGVAQDYSEAAKWYQLAADQGEARAQFNMAAMYDVGLGVPQDFVLRHMWHILATSRASADKAKQYAYLRDRFGSELTRAQVAEAQRLAREWKPKTWAELRPE